MSRRLFFIPRLLIGVGTFVILNVREARSCGPDFPNSYLDSSVCDLMTLPALSFERELVRLLPTPPSPRLSASDETKRLAEAEVREVREALDKNGLSARVIDELVKSYQRELPPSPLPKEFALYAQGAKAWHEENFGSALSAWRELLALPPEQRRYRTVWAAYMVGRMLWARDPNAACESLRLTREAAKQGFADSQELATASLGWEARTRLRSADYTSALKLYFQQFACGDASALASIQLTLRRVFQGSPYVLESGGDASICLMQDVMPYPASDRNLIIIAEDKELRGVVTAWFSSRGGPMLRWSTKEAAVQFNRWLKCLGSMKCLDPGEADRWCWVAYQNGLWDEAEKFADIASANAPASEWVRALLLLRKGQVDDAATHLSNAAKFFPEDAAIAGNPQQPRSYAFGSAQYEQQPLGDMPAYHFDGLNGVFALSRERYVEALRLFLRASHWSDAAYVAEYILTEDELLKYVREEKPTVIQFDLNRECWTPLNLRHLLARRLVRSGRFDEACEFFSDDMKKAFDAYVCDVRLGFDTAQPAKKRAEAFWSAAQYIRKFGMETQGTTLEPDFYIWRGLFNCWPQIWQRRALGGKGPSYRESDRTSEDWKVAQAFVASENELTRAKEIKVPEKRFHYRYRATELAWLAAALLPNDDEQMATILNTAGRWIAARDPQSADLFYKTLVLRCPNTDTGKAAAERRWLVPDGRK